MQQQKDNFPNSGIQLLHRWTKNAPPLSSSFQIKKSANVHNYSIASDYLRVLILRL